jgi:hypothetical protein
MANGRAKLVAVCCVLVVLAVIFVWPRARSPFAQGGLIEYLTNIEESQKKLQQYLANVDGYTPESGCWIERNGPKNSTIKRNATIHCPNGSFFPALPAMLPDGTKFTPTLLIKGRKVIVAPKTTSYAEALSKAIPGSWSAPQSTNNTSYETKDGGCTDALYQSGYLSAMCATGDVTHKMWSTNPVPPQYSIIAYPKPGVAIGNSNGHLAPEADAGNY